MILAYTFSFSYSWDSLDYNIAFKKGKRDVTCTIDESADDNGCNSFISPSYSTPKHECFVYDQFNVGKI